MDIFKAIEARHSSRKFTRAPVPRAHLEVIADAGRRAPTARNEQPWEFVAVTDRARLKELAGLAENGKFIADAGACLAVVSRPSKYYLEDGCAATENILLAATALGHQTCWVAGDKKPYAPAVCRLLGAPEGFLLVSLVAIGKAEATGGRAPKRALDEVLHWEKF
ncbi:MAG TPA: nitroreductase family protein [Kiritimatiellia bacterium]|nr:nitroreductase family protein [Kiritimatiellia bacterium]HRZ12981.1 nitroreductase family protein [Kiritimatiellia bacterium]HSA18409.1 nitroreductase family protein [Kiritimatiellia bacterium]